MTTAEITATEFDNANAEAFAGQMMGMVNQGALALMTSIGHRTGLFSAMAGLAPATSQEIADEAGLHERYVREWLAAMVTGGVVRYDAAKKTYQLPREHSMWLTSDGGGENLAAFVQFLPLVAQVEDKLIDCFRNGGGVPYSAYSRFQAVMAEDSATVHDKALIGSILPLVDGLAEGLNSGGEVLDIGCGRGHAVNLIGQAFPNCQAAGYDLSQEAIAHAKEEASRLGLTNTRFESRDAAQLDETNRYTLITAFDAIHDQAQPQAVLNAISRALQPDGVFLMVDIAASSNLEDNLEHPFAVGLYSISCMHCMTVSLADGGVGLGAVWGEQTARRMLADAGFTNVDVKRIESDNFNNYFIARKG